MRKKIFLNKNWDFHLGEINEPIKIAKKAHAFGGLTAPLAEEKGDTVMTSAGGNHFLKLIAGGNREIGLRNLASTELDGSLGEGWQKIDLPHDWKVQQPYENNPQNLMSGSKGDGISYYRQTFTISQEDLMKQKVQLHFEGIMGISDFWLNGAYLGQNLSGYTAIDFDITEMCRLEEEGLNALLIKVDNTAGHEGWWYEGAGIYKEAWLEIVPETQIIEDSLVVTTEQLADNQAEVKVNFEIKNFANQEKNCQPKIIIFNQEYQFPEAVISAVATLPFEKTIKITAPKLWTPETPNLYEIKVSTPEDFLQKEFGIHTFAYDKDGFYLNHQRYELRGVCEHQDFAGVGVALNQDIVDYKIQLLKEMGVNALRSAHHFASRELLNACDKFGMLLINENRLLENSPWRAQDLEKMVRASRHHACLAFWSVANEEVIGNTDFGERIAKNLVAKIRQLDPQHLIISAELLNPEGIVNEKYLANFDVLGVNYPEAGVMGPGAAIIKKEHPDLPMMSTESASYFSTRGVYRDDEEKCQCNNFGTMFSMILPGKRQPGEPGVGGTAHPEEVMSYLKERPYMGGVFLWTGFDYFGEPSPFQWPAISSQFGILDTCGFKKDYFYYYQAHWQETPFVHVMPHWNSAGLDIDESGLVQVRAFTNLKSAECFVNGKSFGRVPVKDKQVNWQVRYVPGELKVVAYDENEKQVETVQRTSGEVSRIEASEKFIGETTTLYALTAYDEKGIFVPTANQTVHFSVENGQVIGVGNGNPIDHEQNNFSQIKLFNGQALVIVKKESEKTNVRFTIS